MRGHRYGAQALRTNNHGDRIPEPVADKLRILVAAYGWGPTADKLRTTPTTLGKAIDRMPMMPRSIRALEDRLKQYEARQ